MSSEWLFAFIGRNPFYFDLSFHSHLLGVNHTKLSRRSVPNPPNVADIGYTPMKSHEQRTRVQGGEPIRTYYFGHMIGYQPIRDQYVPRTRVQGGELKLLPMRTDRHKQQQIINRYLGHMTGYQPTRDQYFLIDSVAS